MLTCGRCEEVIDDADTSDCLRRWAVQSDRNPAHGGKGCPGCRRRESHWPEGGQGYRKACGIGAAMVVTINVFAGQRMVSIE